MTTFRGILGGTAAVVALLLLSACSPAASQVVRNDSTVVCEEDEPCWDCTTMGNRICGSVNN